MGEARATSDRLILWAKRHLLAGLLASIAAAAVATGVAGRGGCSSSDGTPEGAVRAFVSASRAGNKRAAFDLVGPRTRERLERGAESATQKVGGSRRFRALDMLEILPDASFVPEDYILRSEEGDHAVVEVQGPHGRRDALDVVRVGGRWKVELE